MAKAIRYQLDFNVSGAATGHPALSGMQGLMVALGVVDPSGGVIQAVANHQGNLSMSRMWSGGHITIMGRGSHSVAWLTLYDSPDPPDVIAAVGDMMGSAPVVSVVDITEVS